MVSFAHRRRAHESLGPHRAALCAGGFSVEEPRRARRRLADFVRRHRAVLRQGGIVHRRFWIARKRFERAERRVSAAAEAALPRTAGEASLRQTEYYMHSGAARSADEAAQRAPAVPLLRAVLARMHDGVELQFEPGAAAAGDEDGKADADYGSDGARNSCGKNGQSGSGFVCGQGDEKREANPREGGCGGGERMRIGAPAAEFQVHAVSGRNREFFGRGWKIPDGFGGKRRLGEIPALAKMPPHNHDGVGGMHLYVPWWKYDRKNDFPRGYHIEMGGGRDLPGAGMFRDLCKEEEGYGVGLKRRAREVYGTTVGFAGRGEMIPNPDSYCEIDPVQVDQWGIPVLRFHFKWSEHEIRQAKDMQETFKAIIEMMGGTYKTRTPIDGPRAFGIEAGGRIIHEVGTVRMGADPKSSVLNGYCQSHDVKNLFVTDGAPLVTNPDKNPTLTIMALSWRASEYLLEEAKKGSL